MLCTRLKVESSAAKDTELLGCHSGLQKCSGLAQLLLVLLHAWRKEWAHPQFCTSDDYVNVVRVRFSTYLSQASQWRCQATDFAGHCFGEAIAPRLCQHGPQGARKKFENFEFTHSPIKLLEAMDKPVLVYKQPPHKLMYTGCCSRRRSLKHAASSILHITQI